MQLSLTLIIYIAYIHDSIPKIKLFVIQITSETDLVSLSFGISTLSLVFLRFKLQI